MKHIFLDLETYSEADLRKVGVYVYAAHPSTEITVFAYAIDDGPVRVWDVTTGDACPADLYAALADRAVRIVAHNSPFDRTVLTACWPTWAHLLDASRWHCTMAQAMSHALPGGLEKLGQIFKLPIEQAKVGAGRKLVNLFCKPLPKNSKTRRATRLTHPEQWAEFLHYATQDVTAMRALFDLLPEWNYGADDAQPERALWLLDQQINDRGVCVDTRLAQAAVRAVGRAKKDLDERTVDLTDGAVRSTTQRDVLLQHLVEARGAKLPDLKADTVERRIRDESLPAELRELLSIRLQASSTSTAKYEVFLRATGADGRLRGALQFCGAARTARWAGRLVQLHNMPRPSMKPDEIDEGIEALYADAADLVYDNVMDLASNAIRGCLLPAPGKELVCADLSNIEGRVAAWLAGEAWKLQAFRDFDAGTGPDLYKLAYARAFQVPHETVTKPERQIGKVQELMLGYGGGVGAFITGAMTYGIDLENLARVALPTIRKDIVEEAEGMWDWAVRKRRTLGLPRHIFVTCDGLKRLWREANPAIVTYWGALMNAVASAVNSPGCGFAAGPITIRRDGNWLRCILPSGRSVCYASPRVSDDGREFTYLGVSPYTHQWTRVSSYGGKLLENCDQAMSRDVLASSMQPAEDAGYDICLTVHDELVSEAEIGRGHADLCKIMATPPPWAPGLPLAAAGFTAFRYGKPD